MCLILFAVQPDADYQLVVAANRDELYARPTQTAEFWLDQPEILAGRDLQMGGTWLGVSRSGRFAAVTNFRETPLTPAPPRSRGDLTREFLSGNMGTEAYLDQLKSKGHLFRGFNLLIGDQQGYFYFSNRNGDTDIRAGSNSIVPIEPGFYGLSNQLLNCDWPKVTEGMQELRNLSGSGFESEKMFDLLFNKGDDSAFSASFIESSEYGTCASTLLKIKNDGEVIFEERNFLPEGQPSVVNQYEFNILDNRKLM